MIVVDNHTSGGLSQFQSEIEDIRCAVDFREILVWREGGSGDRRVKDIGKTLHEDDIINLQFTR